MGRSLLLPAFQPILQRNQKDLHTEVLLLVTYQGYFGFARSYGVAPAAAVGVGVLVAVPADEKVTF